MRDQLQLQVLDEVFIACDQSDWGLNRLAHEVWQHGSITWREKPSQTKLQCVLRGQMQVVLDQRTYLAQAGMVFMTEPGLSRRIEVVGHESAELLIVSTVGSTLADACRHNLGSASTSFAVADMLYVQQYFQCMLRTKALRQQIAILDGMVTGLIPLLASLQLDRTETSQAFAHYQQALAFLDDPALALEKPAELAAALDLSVAYVSRLFKRFHGQRPGQALAQRRMHRAAHTLVTHNWSVAEVAAHHGFSDAFTFSRAFKQIMGCSPKKWRE